VPPPDEPECTPEKMEEIQACISDAQDALSAAFRECGTNAARMTSPLVTGFFLLACQRLARAGFRVKRSICAAKYLECHYQVFDD